MIIVAVGANLPGEDGQPPLAACLKAVQALGDIEGLQVVAVSRWYLSAPQPVSDQPPYVNGVVRLTGHADPAALLARLHDIEAMAGRVRTVPNAARPLDLDLIDCNAIVCKAAHLILPHPRAHERAFVLLPLAEVAPGWVHPRLGLTVEQLVSQVGPQQILALPPPGA